jgi:hypothetical protein
VEAGGARPLNPRPADRQLHMSAAVEQYDPAWFVHAIWSLHARIAAISPHAMLRSLHVNLLDQPQPVPDLSQFRASGSVGVSDHPSRVGRYPSRDGDPGNLTK